MDDTKQLKNFIAIIFISFSNNNNYFLEIYQREYFKMEDNKINAFEQQSINQSQTYFFIFFK